MNNLFSMTTEFRALMAKAQAEARAKKAKALKQQAQNRKEVVK